jgi:WD40 repeat protein
VIAKMVTLFRFSLLVFGTAIAVAVGHAKAPGFDASETAMPPVRYFTAAVPSPDGGAVAYSLSAGQASDFQSVSELVVQELGSNALTALPGSVRLNSTGAFNQIARPAWSPDGRHLAYVSIETGRATLRIWDRSTGSTIKVPGVVPCSLNGQHDGMCVRNSIEWTHDSRRVLFLGLPDGTYSQIQAQRADLSFATAGRRQDNPEFEVRTTHEKSSDLGSVADRPADIFAYDLARASLEFRTSGSAIQAFRLSPSDRTILAIARSARVEPVAKQAYQDFLLVSEFKSTSSPREGGASLGANDGSLAAAPETLITARQSTPLISWSPSGRSFAYIEQGALSDGDVNLVDLATRRTEVLTRRVHFQNDR